MTINFKNYVSAAILVSTMVVAAPVMAENMAQSHMGHVSTSWGDTPDEKGLLPTAHAEAKIAAYHADVATTEPTDLEWMKSHALHVLHAVNGEGDGPGLGYGVKQAASGVAYHIGVAAAEKSASDNIKTHAPHVSTSSNNVVMWVDAIEKQVAKIQAAKNAAEAAPLTAQLKTLASTLKTGVDANGDGDITWEKGEGGLDAASYHMDIMTKGENL